MLGWISHGFPWKPSQTRHQLPEQQATRHSSNTPPPSTNIAPGTNAPGTQQIGYQLVSASLLENLRISVSFWVLKGSDFTTGKTFDFFLFVFFLPGDLSEWKMGEATRGSEGVTQLPVQLGRGLATALQLLAGDSNCFRRLCGFFTWDVQRT